MNVVIFVLGLIVAGLFASMFTAKALDAPDALVVGAAVLCWLGVFGLVWTQWLRKSGRGLMRIAAVVSVVMLVATLYAWIPQTDLFVEYRRNCPPRAGSFWKLIATWAGGAVAMRYSLVGQWFGPPLVQRVPATPDRMRWPGRVMLAVWSIACWYVLARNLSMDVVQQSFKAAGGILIFAGIITVIAAVVWFQSIPSRKRRQQAQRDFAALSPERKRELVAIADRYAQSVEHCIFYRGVDASDWDVRNAHIGGSALLPSREAWPIDDEGNPGRFLLQLPIPDVLPAPWPGRSLALWVTVGGFDVLVRSYAGTDAFVEVPQLKLPDDYRVGPVSKAHLQPLALPVQHDRDDEAQGDEYCELLLQECAELRDALAGVTSEPSAVLPMLLRDDMRVHYLEPGDGVLVGGEPQFIQGEHDPVCELCKQPMRFLMSSGDFTDDMAFGDVGVAYVYGCDEHPEHCQAFVDCH